jgi:ribosomal protein S18 acetylase RimI-like enzyme
MHQSLAAAPARPDELEPAFRLIFKHLGSTEREARVENALRLIRRGELDAQGVWIVRDEEAILGAMVCMLVPGASGLVWPPQAASPRWRIDIENQLLRSALDWLRQGGAKLAQALLLQEEKNLAASLERNGFVHITDLWYLHHHLGFPAELLTENRSLLYEAYTRCDRDLFHETLLRTYEGTQDCPEVNGMRSLSEVIEGHQAQGSHDPARWWLAHNADRPVGVLLLTEIPEWHGWDLSYVGVVPEARCQGVGRELTRKALRDAQAAGASQVTLAVDVRNQPARSLYQSLGFEPFDQREVYLATW